MIPDPGFQKPTPYFAAAVERKLYTSSFISCIKSNLGKVKAAVELFSSMIHEYP